MQQEVLKQELQKFNVTDTAISEMKEKFMPLCVADLNDKEGLKAVHDARILVKGKRVEVEKVRKALNADALTWQKAVNEEAKRITGLLEPIESHLEAEEEKVEKEKERIQKEKERQEQDRINARIANLIAAGCMYDGVSYSFAHLTIDALQIKLMDDQPFAEFMSAILIQKEQEEAKKAEAERIKQEEEAKLKAEREALEKAKKEQQDREDKFRREQEEALKARAEHEAELKAEQERIVKEAAEIQQKKEQSRVNDLAVMGLSEYSYKDQSFFLGDITVAMIDIRNLGNNEWDALVAKLTPSVAQHRKESAAREAEQIKIAQEAAAEKAKLETEEKLRQEAERKAIQEATEKAETERQEALRPDKEKLQDFATGITGLVIPTVNSEGA